MQALVQTRTKFVVGWDPGFPALILTQFARALLFLEVGRESTLCTVWAIEDMLATARDHAPALSTAGTVRLLVLGAVGVLVALDRDLPGESLE